MIRAWRLSKARYAGNLTDQGAARDGQRWNHAGQRAVYLGMTPEITVLEVLVHLNGMLSAPLVLCGYDVLDTPGLIKEVDPKALPAGWNGIPHGQASAGLAATGSGQESSWACCCLQRWCPRPATSCSILCTRSWLRWRWCIRSPSSWINGWAELRISHGSLVCHHTTSGVSNPQIHKR